MTYLKGFLFTLFFVALFSSNDILEAGNNPTSTKETTTTNANYNFSIQTVGAKNKTEMVIVPTARINFYAPIKQNKENLQYHWTFNDGTTSIETNPVHTFDVCGEYMVSLTVTDASGQLTTQTISKQITVNGLCLDLDNVPKIAQRYKIPAGNNNLNVQDIVAEK